MASFSQVRLAQLSGSFGTSAGQMNDLLAPLAKASHSGSQQGKSLADHLSHVVSAIKRIHGASEFSNQTAATLQSAASYTIDATTDIILDADGGNIYFKDGGTTGLDIELSHGHVILTSSVSDKDIIFAVNDGGNTTEVARFDGSASSFLVAGTGSIQFTDANAYINHDGTDLQIVDDADINLKPAADLLVDAGADIILDAAGNDITFKAGSSDSTGLKWTQSGSGDWTALLGTSNKDLIFKVNDGGSATEVMRLDGDVSALLIKQDKKIMLGNAEEYVYGDGTDIHFGVGTDGDINIPADIGLTFGNDGEKIEGNGTDLTIAGNNINLTAVADVVIPANVGLTFGSGEKIEGDSTDLTVTSGGAINLTAATDVVVPVNVGITFGTHEKIESDDTDLNITVGGGGDINIPQDIGLTFGDDGEKIEGDGTNLSIASSGELDLTAGANLDVNVTGTAHVQASSTLTLDTTDTSNGIKIATTSGVPVTIGHTLSEVNVGDNLNVAGDAVITGNLTINGSTTTVSTTNMVVEDKLIELANGASGTPSGDLGLVFERGSSTNVFVGWDESADVFLVGSGSFTGATTGNLSLTPATFRAARFELIDSNASLEVVADVLTMTDNAAIELVATSGDIVLDAGGDVVIDGESQKLEFGSAGSGEHITGDGDDLTVASGRDINLTATTDINIPSGVGLTFGNDGEKIEGNGSKLDIAAANVDFSIESGGDITIPANIGLTFGSGEKIEGDSTDLTVTSGGKINLTATSDVILPNNVGMLFGDVSNGGEKIEGDGSGLTIAGGSLTLDSEGDVNIDAGGADIIFKDDGTEFGRIIKSSSDMIVSGAIGDIILDPAGGNVLPSADSSDSLGSDATSASHTAGSSASGFTSNLSSGQSFAMNSSQSQAVLYGSSISAPSGTSAPSGITTSTLTTSSLSIFGSSPSGTLSFNGNSGASVSAGTIMSIQDSGGNKFFFVVVEDYSGSSGSSSMKVHALTNVSGHTTSVSSFSQIQQHGSGFSGSGLSAGDTFSAGETVKYTFSGGTAVFVLEADIGSGNVWGFVGDPRNDLSTLSTFSSSGSPSSATAGGSVTEAASANAWANLYVDSIDLNGQGSLFLDGDKNCSMSGTATGLVLSGAVDNAKSIHLIGYGMTFEGNDVNDSIYFENSPIKLEALAAGGEPSSTAGKLYNVTGSLVWAGSVITPRSQKVSYSVTASHASDTDLVISGLSHDAGVNSLNSDVYLNGQLMLSGASSTAGDYKLSGTATNVRFHFGLEADDVVTVITMG